MTLLVAGDAAVFDLILEADSQPSDAEVGVLRPSPGAAGRWLPGGAAFTIALAARRQGVPVSVWHALPMEGADSVTIPLQRAGVDLSRAPRRNFDAGRCVLVRMGQRRAAWSTANPIISDVDFESILPGVTHVAVASRWGDWTEKLLAAAVRREIPVSLVGEPSERLSHFRWAYVVLDEHQFARSGKLDAEAVVVTRGSAGATLHVEGTAVEVPTVAATVVDTTGAGDAFGGAFIACLMQGQGQEAAAQTAARVAAGTCEGWGAWAGLSAPLGAEAERTRELSVRGALAGTACGDAFGMPNSFLPNPPWRKEMAPGPIESPYHAGYPAGRITDDTEQAIALTDALEDGFTAEAVARRLNDWFVSVGGEASLAVGPSTKRAMLAYQAKAPLAEIGRTGVTNGAAMRISPIGVVAGLESLSLEALVDAVEVACLPTHHTAPAIAGAAAIAAAVAAGVEGLSWDEVMHQAVAGARLGAGRGAWIYSPDVADRIVYARRLAATAGDDQELVHLISDVVGAGEPSTESVPAALAICDYVRGDPARAIEISGNLRGDTDTIAAMAGAVCGAHAGEGALPRAWVELVSRVNNLDFSRWCDRLTTCAATGLGREPPNRVAARASVKN